MAVNTPHPDYLKNRPIWDKLRACVEGEDAVKALREQVLPRLEEDSDDDYLAYLGRALYYNATGRTMDGLHGAIFRKEPNVDLGGQEELQQTLKYIGKKGEDFNEVCRAVVDEVLVPGRCGLLTDYPVVDTDKMEDYAEEDLHAYLCLYTAEQIINWKTQRIQGRQKPVLFVLEECREVPLDQDGFAYEREIIYRVLRLVLMYDEATERSKWTYIQEEWIPQKNERTKQIDYVKDKSFVPKIGGQSLDYIPFTVFGPKGTDVKIEKSPLYDLMCVNLSHFRSSADLEHGRFWTSLPTPYVTGLPKNSSKVFRMGSRTAWNLPEKAMPGLVEYKGAGLQYLENALVTKEGLMVHLGAMLLRDQKRASETAESMRIQNAGESSVLAKIVTAVGLGLTQSLRWWTVWEAGNEENVSVTMNKEFFETMMASADLSDIVSAWQNGGLPLEALAWNIKMGNRVPPDWKVEDILKKLEAEAEQKAERDAAQRPPSQPPGPQDPMDPNDPEPAGDNAEQMRQQMQQGEDAPVGRRVA